MNDLNPRGFGCFRNLLLIDHDDSFTQNLGHWLIQGFGSVPRLINFRQWRPSFLQPCDLLVLSPGPGHPLDYPWIHDLSSSSCPILGICLGMQMLHVLTQGNVSPLDKPRHGKTRLIFLEQKVREVGAYHSLHCQGPMPAFAVARDTLGTVQVLRHRVRPWLGFQFHPESFLTREPDFWSRYVKKQLFALD
jgi:para-aminobenzoate synthetase component 2